MNSSTPTPAHSATGTNGETSIDDLFALSDEQILEIDPEAQDVEIADGHPDTNEFDELSSPARAAGQQSSRATHSLDSSQGDSHAGETSEAGRASQQATQNASPASTEHTAAPPEWLADRMSDPQHGTEARELWNSSQLVRQSEQARQEAAAFREVFAKPDDARAAAQRARLLDDIDRAYFAGDATQRASLAASMLREDPAAFREMVFAGLRALEEAGQRHATAGQSSVANAMRPDTASSQQSSSSQHGPSAVPVGAQHAAPQPGTMSATERSTSQASTNHPSGSTTQDAAHLAAYTAFERSANEDLERTVGTAIDRTLDQALPHATRADSAAMKTRLAAPIRQDVEKALQGDRQLGEQVAQVLAARRFDNEARASVVRLIGERAQQLVPGSAKRILSEWTQTTLAAHRGQRDRSDAATARREVALVNKNATTQSVPAPRAAATAASSQRSSQQSSPRRQSTGLPSQPGGKRGVDYRRLSDEQILDL